MVTEFEEPEAPGWDAIDSAVDSLYPGQKPKHWAAQLPAMLGGKDYLQGVSAFVAGEPAHWHFITYGFSELYEKESSNPDLSGFGFELTFRLLREGSDEPPGWVFSFLQNLGRYVFSTGNVLEPGHHLNLNGPIALGSDTRIRAIGFVDDPDLPAIATPNGRLGFIQVVGLTLELAAVKSWDAGKFLDLLAVYIPKSLTDLGRSSLLDLAPVAEAVRVGAETDGSSTGLLYVSALSWRQERGFVACPRTAVVLGANVARDFSLVLAGRLPYGRALSLLGPNSQVVFEPGSASAVAAEEDCDLPTLRVAMPPERARELAALVKPRRGRYLLRGLPGLELVVEPSVIKTTEGNVAEVIG